MRKGVIKELYLYKKQYEMHSNFIKLVSKLADNESKVTNVHHFWNKWM